MAPSHNPSMGDAALSPVAHLHITRLSPQLGYIPVVAHIPGAMNVTWPFDPCGSHVLDLSSDEETVGVAHSFCSDFQGMHLWESSSIQARVL